MAEPVIRAEGLARHYGRVRAVDGLDLDVRAGEVYGFLGRNGAGKTTTIRMLLGLVRPTTGTVRVFGRVIGGRQDWLRRVGFLVESATAYPNLTVRENLDLQRRLTGAPPTAVDETIELLGLAPYADRRAGRLSLGNKQRLSLARAILHAPELLILDEPANALDPAGIVEVRELLRRLADSGVTVFMSSHILGEVAHLADRIGIIDAGRLVEEASRDELAARARDYVRDSYTEAQRQEAQLSADLERYFLARTTPEPTEAGR
jgi:ABC-2 type transport system ATP-binding protein